MSTTCVGPHLNNLLWTTNTSSRHDVLSCASFRRRASTRIPRQELRSVAECPMIGRMKRASRRQRRYDAQRPRAAHASTPIARHRATRVSQRGRMTPDSCRPFPPTVPRTCVPSRRMPDHRTRVGPMRRAGRVAFASDSAISGASGRAEWRKLAHETQNVREHSSASITTARSGTSRQTSVT
jgi:hypothetical protein